MVFLLIARLIRDKGVVEFAESARIITAKHPNTRFELLGFIDPGNPGAISEAQIREWEREGILKWLGRSDDVRPSVAASDCVVLPSYREGTPRTLLEAAAMAKPIITTDAIGCRQTVDDGETGFLCEMKNPGDLAEKMEWMIRLSAEKREAMGRRGRDKMVRYFDENLVIEKYMQGIKEILGS